MICNIKKIIRIAVVTSVLLIYGGEVHAFGFPMLFKTYLADAMRTWTLTAMSKAKTTQEHNNLKFVEEAIERGNVLEVALMYDTFKSGKWDEFGNDPFGYIKKSAEKALKKEANEYIKLGQKEGKKYLEEKLNGKDKDKDKDKDNQGEGNGQGSSEGQGSGEGQGGQGRQNQGTDIIPGANSQAEADKKRDEKYKATVFNWYKNTRSMLGHTSSGNAGGLIDDVTGIIQDNSDSQGQGSTDGSSADQQK